MVTIIFLVVFFFNIRYCILKVNAFAFLFDLRWMRESMSLSFMQRGLSFCHLFVKAGKCKNKRRELPSNKTYSLIGRQLIEIRSVCDVIQVCG